MCVGNLGSGLRGGKLGTLFSRAGPDVAPREPGGRSARRCGPRFPLRGKRLANDASNHGSTIPGEVHSLKLQI